MYSRIDIPDNETISSFFPEKGDFSYIELSSREIEDSSFIECRMPYGHLPSCILRRLEFRNTDLSNTGMDASHQVDVLYDSCLLTGTSFLKSTLKKVTFSGCRGLYTVFSNIKADELLFKDSVFEDSDFSHITGKKIVFENCTLKSCNFVGTELKSLKLEDTVFDGIYISEDAREARGAVLSLDNALAVLSSLDIEVDMTL